MGESKSCLKLVPSSSILNKPAYEHAISISSSLSQLVPLGHLPAAWSQLMKAPGTEHSVEYGKSCSQYNSGA